MSSHSETGSKKGPSDNEKAMASFVSGAIIFVFNLIHSIFLTIFRIFASMV